MATEVFFSPRAFAHKYEVSVGVDFPENSIGAGFTKLAFPAGFDFVGVEFLQCSGLVPRRKLL